MVRGVVRGAWCVVWCGVVWCGVVWCGVAYVGGEEEEGRERGGGKEVGWVRLSHGWMCGAFLPLSPLLLLRFSGSRKTLLRD